VDLLALVVGTGADGESARSLAVHLLDSAGTLAGIARLGGHALAERRGFGPAKATRILAALELGGAPRSGTLRAAADLRILRLRRGVARPRLATLEHEEVWLLTLDGRNGLRGAHRVAQGGLHGCALLPRTSPGRVARRRERDGAPSQSSERDPSPSIDDVR